MISDMMQLKRYGASTVLKTSDKRTALSKLLTPEQMEMFNQLAGKEVTIKRRRESRSTLHTHTIEPVNRLMVDQEVIDSIRAGGSIAARGGSQLQTYGAMLVKSDALARQFESKTRLLKKQPSKPTYMVFNEIETIKKPSLKSLLNIKWISQFTQIF